MAVILFKKGGYKICDENSFQHELANGWFLSKAEAETDWASDLLKAKELEAKELEDGELEDGESKIDKNALIKELRTRKAELIAEQNKE